MGRVCRIGLPGSMSSVATLLRFSAGPDELTGAGARRGGGDLFRQYSARPDLKIRIRKFHIDLTLESYASMLG